MDKDAALPLPAAKRRDFGRKEDMPEQGFKGYDNHSTPVIPERYEASPGVNDLGKNQRFNLHYCSCACSQGKSTDDQVASLRQTMDELKNLRQEMGEFAEWRREMEQLQLLKNFVEENFPDLHRIYECLEVHSSTNEELKEDVKTARADVGKIKADIAAVKEDVKIKYDTATADIAAVKEDAKIKHNTTTTKIAAVKEDAKTRHDTTKADIAALKKDIATIKHEVRKTDADIKRNTTAVSRQKQEIKNHRSDFTSSERALRQSLQKVLDDMKASLLHDISEEKIKRIVAGTLTDVSEQLTNMFRRIGGGGT